MSTTSVQIFRRKDKTLVEAVLHTELAASALIEAEKQWGANKAQNRAKAQARGQARRDPAALSLGLGQEKPESGPGQWRRRDCTRPTSLGIRPNTIR
jgi:hypothetical protein